MIRSVTLLVAACALLALSGTANADCRDFESATRDLYRSYRAAALREMQKYREKQQKVDVKEFWAELSNRYIAEGKNVSAMIGVFIAGMKDKLHDPAAEKAICKLGEAAENTTPMFVCATLIAHDPVRTRAQKIIEMDKMVSEAGWSLKKRQALAKNKAAAAANDPFIKRMRLHFSALDKCYGTKLAAKLPQAAATPATPAAPAAAKK